MMNPKALFHWLYEHMRNYNLFMSEIDVDDDEGDQTEQPAIVVKRQKYATWVYILLLICK